ncbi:tripartite motif-containing protein 2-like [Ptychodera flava]|uniref:tripartite motif-containing protein 2-like n=1 Tax=Ptychodera flava TaxID=63121 RepID=UPI00396A7A12
MSSSKTRQLGQLLQCPVCKRAFQRPVVLPCFHLACRGCVAAKPECVVCDKKFDTIDSTTKGLTSAHFIEHLVKSGGKAINAKVYRLCKECPSPAQNYCTKCDHFLCDRCKKIHGRITTKLHNIITIDEYKREIKRSFPCPTHRDKDVEFMCSACDIPICVDCIERGALHEEHEYVDLSAGIGDMVKSNKEVLDDARTAAAEMDGNLEFLRNTKSDLLAKKDLVLGDIRSHIDEYLKAVWESGQKLLNDSNNTFDKSVSFISSKIDRGDETLSNLEGLSDLGENIFQNGDSPTRFFLARRCSEEMTKLIRRKFTVAADDIISADFTANKDSLASFSTVQLGSLDRQQVPIPKGLEGPPEEINSVSGENVDKSSLENNNSFELLTDVDAKHSTDDNRNITDEERSKTLPAIIAQSVGTNRHSTGESSSANGKSNVNVLEEGRHAVQDGIGKIDQHKLRTDSEKRYSFWWSPTKAYGEKKRLYTAKAAVTERREEAMPTKYSEDENVRSYYIPDAKERNIAKQNIREEGDLGEDSTLGSVGFQEPHGIAVSSSGYIAVADTKNSEVKLFDDQRKFIRALKIKRHVFMPGKVVPFDVAFVDDDHLAVTDFENDDLIICNLSGKLIKRIEDGALRKPKGVAVDGMGRILVVDSKSCLVRVYSIESGERLLSFGSGDENAEGQLADPWFIAVDSARNVLVSDSSKSCLQVFDQEGLFLYRCNIRLGTQGRQRISPCGLYCDQQGNIYVTRYDAGGVYAFDAERRYMFEFGESWQNYFGIAVFAHRSLPWCFYVTDKVGNSVYVFQKVSPD